ncbi:hypothetical protein [Tenacibaculum piscium]|uniref:hypothetical protein n=2 Tax=Tenacibaculum TaxID=104267 RepID=UPI001EFC27F1|nr:hypothetical protein [Tenacibaculum piscium]MCG8184435.1 hypothetical protein [Tenacibaculum piscium]
MKKQSLWFLVLTLIGIILYSCQNDDDFEKENLTSQTTEQEQIESPDKIIGLGKKLENPFTVSVMKQAYENLKAKKSNQFSKSSTNDLTIETTDYYVRFLPKSDEEKETLQVQDSLMLFDMPLDYELEEGVAGAYHDPSVPEGEITWQYTVVPVDYQFRDIQYEILANLFLQEEDDDEKDDISTSSSRKVLRNQLNEDLWTELENEALRITGNEDDIIEESSSSLAARRRKWYPSGRIQYEDNTTATSRIIPLQGAQVVVKRWFRWRRAITDSNGNFRVGKFRSKKVKCAIKWERHDWDIRSGSYGQAWYSFETLRRGRSWNKIIRRNSTPRNWLYASVHRGAMEYFYNYRAYGIKKPYSKRCRWCRRLHIGAKWKPNGHWFSDHYFTFNKIWWAAPVVVYSHGKSGNDRNSRQIFATTVHELAHVSHWEIGYSTGQYVIDALADDPFLPESWATGVEYVVVERVYPRATFGTYNFDYQQQRTLRYIQTESDGYTPIVIDMIDNHNQSTINSNRPNDRVSGYTLGQLEDALPGSFGSWWRWRTRLREMYKNPTDGAELDYLFREYR